MDLYKGSWVPLKKKNKTHCSCEVSSYFDFTMPLQEREYLKQVVEKFDPRAGRDDEEEDEDDDDDTYEDSSIPWTNLIFLPFNPIFEAVIMTTVLLLSTLVNPLFANAVE